MQDANTSLTLNASVTSAATNTGFSQCPPWPIVPVRIRQASTVPDSLYDRILVLLPHLWFEFILVDDGALVKYLFSENDDDSRFSFYER